MDLTLASQSPRRRELLAQLGLTFEVRPARTDETPRPAEDARAYVLCCLAREARPDLGEADIRFLQGVAESLRPLLEHS